MMGDGSNRRRLVAILAADVAGYTRLVEKDTDGTVAAWTAARDDVIKPAVAAKSGHITKFTGDGFIVEFPSVQDATDCAIDLQKRLSSNPLKFRMGVNVGDVLDDGGDIHGEGVNIAARLESLAEPGGICISGDVYNQIRNRVDATFTDMGNREVKHVSRPIHVYAIGAADDTGAGNMSAGIVDVEIANAGAAIGRDKPSIAILPFSNMSSDPEQEYFADGITEDIITELSRYQSLFVISRNSSFVFKGRSIDIIEAGKQLACDFLVEGSIRKVGNRVRITAQLIEAGSGNHLWAERYDRSLEDIFDVQDEVTNAIVSVLPTRIEQSRVHESMRGVAKGFSAYDLYLRGRWIFENSLGGDSAAVSWLQKSIAADPTFAMAHSTLAGLYAYNVFSLGVWYGDQEALARPYIEQSLKFGGNNASVHEELAHTYFCFGDFDRAQEHVRRAKQLNPNDLTVAYTEGFILSYSGDAAAGMELIRQCCLRDPILAATNWEQRGETLYLLRDYKAAVSAFEDAPDPPPHTFSHIAACYAQMGRMENALAAVSEFRSRCSEDVNFARYAANHARICKRQEDAENWMEGYRKAGLLE